MSTRTIIEINHDYLRQISPQDLVDLQRYLASGDAASFLSTGKGPLAVSGIRILAQRHHSETITVKVG